MLLVYRTTLSIHKKADTLVVSCNLRDIDSGWKSHCHAY